MARLRVADSIELLPLHDFPNSPIGNQDSAFNGKIRLENHDSKIVETSFLRVAYSNSLLAATVRRKLPTLNLNATERPGNDIVAFRDTTRFTSPIERLGHQNFCIVGRISYPVRAESPARRGKAPHQRTTCR